MKSADSVPVTGSKILAVGCWKSSHECDLTHRFPLPTLSKVGYISPIYEKRLSFEAAKFPRFGMGVKSNTEIERHRIGCTKGGRNGRKEEAGG